MESIKQRQLCTHYGPQMFRHSGVVTPTKQFKVQILAPSVTLYPATTKQSIAIATSIVPETSAEMTSTRERNIFSDFLVYTAGYDWTRKNAYTFPVAGGTSTFISLSSCGNI